MAQLNKAIEIVRYHEGLAAGIAKMWNMSRDSWGGDTRVMTEEQVKAKEANSDNIELYLAMDGEEVVGYCGLSEYKEDTGSLYIPLLNVRPDYHGHKIGKKLVRMALEKTIELGWPRLDLYTWPGNTKAVPLYKKCGFFWEDRDDTTHLMNFIPQVLNTPLLRQHFVELDWYESSIRQIEVNPDGVKKNGFSFYEYSWQNETRQLRVQFERTGRGISLIETDDFLLEISTESHEVIEQDELGFRIRIVNKGTAPLDVRAFGTGNERVVYDLEEELTVEDEAVLPGIFTVKKGEEPSIWRTHPTLAATITINGLECELKLGLFPVQPAKIKAVYFGNLCFLNKGTYVELEIKNHLNEDADFEICFPPIQQAELEREQFTSWIPSGGRKKLSIPLRVKQYGFCNPLLSIKARKKDGTKLSFEQEIAVAFKGIGEKFGGETKDHWHIFNGLAQVNVRKRDLLMTAGRNQKAEQPCALMAPKLGKPYSLEFTKKKPASVIWEANDSSILLEIRLESSEMEGIHLTQAYQLFSEGIVHSWGEVENSGSITHPEVALSQPIYHELGKTYFPLDGKVVRFSESKPLEVGDLNPSSITGNWYFSEDNGEPIGVSWSPESKAAPEGWQFIIEDRFGRMEPGAKHASGKITLAIGTFQHVDEFKAYAEQMPVKKTEEPADELDFRLERMIASPAAEIPFTLKTYRNSYLDGNLTINAAGQEWDAGSIVPQEEKVIHSGTFPSPGNEPVSILSAIFSEKYRTSVFSELLLLPNGKVGTSIAEDGSLSASNGRLELKTNPSYYPGLYSIMVDGQEWLDHSYPERTAKAWWNPWAGGMKTAPSGINTFSLLKEKTSAAASERLDSAGNKWSGIAITTEITENGHWKGAVYVQYYLMLPGVPVLASFVELKKDGGKIVESDLWVTDLFLGCPDLTELGVSVTGNSHTQSYRAGLQEIPFFLNEDSSISFTNRPEKLYFIPGKDSGQIEGYMNKDAFQLTVKQPGMPEYSRAMTDPLFLLFDDRVLSAELVKKLKRIQFPKESP